jgi:hypothetical protein
MMEPAATLVADVRDTLVLVALKAPAIVVAVSAMMVCSC